MLVQNRRQFWNRQSIPNKSTISDFCYFRMNNKNVVFIPYNFYIPIENAMWIENADENQKSEMILLLGILWRFQNCPRFCSSVIRFELYTFENGQMKKKKKKKKKNNKKTKPKKVQKQNVFLFLILRMYTKFHKNRSINKKSALKPIDPLKFLSGCDLTSIARLHC